MTDIKIPIKEIIEKFENRYDCHYEWDEKCLARRFFIACLNLRYIMPDELEGVVSKFAKKIKKIDFSLSEKNGLEYYKIAGNTLFGYAGLKEYDEKLYEKTVFKAISEAIIGIDEDNVGISNAFSEMLSKRVYNMDVNGERVLLPLTETYKVGDASLELRTGYERYNLVINLLKQLCIAKEISEQIILIKMIKGDFKEEISKVFFDTQSKLLLKMLEAIALMDEKRIITGDVNSKEIEYIVRYQKMVNDLFEEADQGYFAFCALITSSDLRRACMEKFKNDVDDFF